MSETKLEFEMNPNDEEIIEESEELDEEEQENIKETEPKSKKETLELDFSMDPVERLEKEINFTDEQFQKIVGNILLDKFQTDEILKNCYRERKITLEDTCKSIVKEAHSRAIKGAAYMADCEVFGLAIHFVQDGETKEKKQETFTLTKEAKQSIEEQAKAEYLAKQKKKLEEADKKRKEQEKQKLEKEENKRKESGQLSLFE